MLPFTLFWSKVMTERVQNTLKTWVLVGGTIAAIAFAWARLEGQITQVELHKADRAEVVALRAETQELLRRLDERSQQNTALLQKIVCRTNPSDSVCPQ